MAQEHGHAPQGATFLSTGAAARVGIAVGPLLLLWLAVWWALA